MVICCDLPASLALMMSVEFLGSHVRTSFSNSRCSSNWLLGLLDKSTHNTLLAKQASFATQPADQFCVMWATEDPDNSASEAHRAEVCKLAWIRRELCTPTCSHNSGRVSALRQPSDVSLPCLSLLHRPGPAVSQCQQACARWWDLKFGC